jgi:thiol-disulfide isomerase/thioredoxin
MDIMTRSSSLSRFCVCICFAISTLASAAMPVAGDIAPDNLGVTLKDEPVRLKDYAGKAVVISFWASWCPYCLKELPVLYHVQKAAKGRLQVVAINTEDDDTFRKLARAMRTLDIAMSYDPEHKARDAFGVNGIPHMVIIGSDGRIVEVFRGYDESSLKPIVAAINRAIGAGAPESASP